MTYPRVTANASTAGRLPAAPRAMAELAKLDSLGKPQKVLANGFFPTEHLLNYSMRSIT
jgi:hypothetical protein